MTEADQKNPQEQQGDGSRTLSRRKILAGLGVGGAVLGVPSVAVAARGGRDGGRAGRSDRRRSGEQSSGFAPIGAPSGDNGLGPFVRIFDGPAFAEPSDALTAALVEVGSLGGIMDAKDPLEVGPIRLITEPELSPNNRDNPTHTAGSTFVGQFLDHDITSDAGSTLGVPKPVTSSHNLRSARFDLDSIYGGGPEVSPHLYRDGRRSYGRFILESGGQFEDLPRASNGTAIVAEPRNDENLIISGLQAAFLSFHNEVLRIERRRGRDEREAFARTQRVVRWHYQWLIMNQFLPQYVGREMVDDILRNGREW